MICSYKLRVTSNNYMMWVSLKIEQPNLKFVRLVKKHKISFALPSEHQPDVQTSCTVDQLFGRPLSSFVLVPAALSALVIGGAFNHHPGLCQNFLASLLLAFVLRTVVRWVDDYFGRGGFSWKGWDRTPIQRCTVEIDGVRSGRDTCGRGQRLVAAAVLFVVACITSARAQRRVATIRIQRWLYRHAATLTPHSGGVWGEPWGLNTCWVCLQQIVL